MLRTGMMIVFAIAVVVALVAMSLTSSQLVQTDVVRRSDVEAYVDEQATTRLPQVYEITMPFAGRIEAITLREGDLVQQGNVVARLVPQELDDDVAEAEAAVARLAARILDNDDVSVEKTALKQAELFVDAMRSTVASAEARQTATKSQLDYSETFLGRVRDLIESGASTRDQLDQAELSHVQSQVNYREDVLSTDSLKATQAATDLLPKMIADYVARRILSHEALAQEQAEARARLRRIKQRHQQGTMASPITGVVLERNTTNEQFLAPGAVILRLGQLDQLEISVDLLTEDVGRVRVGDPVRIYGPAIEADVDFAVAGMVYRIFPAGFTKLSSLGVEQQRVTVIVRFADGVLPKLLAERHLGVDFRVRVRIVTDQVAGKLVVPRSCVFQGVNGRQQAYVVRNARAVLQTVDVGLVNESVVEITSGVNESEEIVVAPASSLRDGVRVHTESAN